MANENLILKDIVRNLRMKPAVYLSPTASLREAVAMMQKEGVTSIVVGSESDLQGILTEEGVLKTGLPKDMDLDQPLSKYMYSPVETIRADQTVDAALEKMITTNFRHLPVLDGNKVIGVVRTQGVVKYIAEFYPALILNLPPDPKIPPEVFGG